MYNLGEEFKIDYALALANPKNIIKGNKYRFTVLSNSLIRLEYSEDGNFTDAPTRLAWYRNMEPVRYTYNENDKMLEIKTNYFRLVYHKDKPFFGGKLNPIANLKVEVLNSSRVWYYGHPEARNFGAPGISLENSDNKIKLKKGLYSLDGFATIDDSKTDIILPNGEVNQRNNKTIDIYLFIYNNDFNVCLKDYYMITGHPSLIPRYALGNWWYKNESYNTEKTIDLMNKFKDKEIPLSLILLNKDWSIGKTFTWNGQLFNNPVELVQTLHRNGVRIGLSIDPLGGFNKDDVNYNQIAKYLPEVNGSIPFNVYDPKYLDVYFKLLINPLDMIGVDFYYINADDAKYSNTLGLLNHYQFLYAKRNYKIRPMIVSRNDGVARHRYSVTYVGKSVVSWDSLKILSFLNLCSTNIGNNYLVYDIGGYYKGMEDNELYMRFVQLGVFSPIMKFGSDKGIFYKREPWKWSYKTYKIAKDYLILRHRMIPYLYSEGYKYSKDGVPIITPLYYKYSDFYDDNLYKNEYYFGSQLFIAPIIKKKDYITNRVIHKFFLPEGVWYDFSTGKKYIGNNKHLGFYKDEEYPCFAKAGAIIPLTDYREDMNINDTTPPKNLEINIFPGMPNSYDLYEDDGVSELYKRGYYILTNISSSYSKNERKIVVQAKEGKTGIIPDYRNYRFNFRNTRPANEVVVKFNGISIPYETRVHNNDFIVSVANVKTVGNLEISIKGENLNIEAFNMFKDSIESILQDLPIETTLKESVQTILFKDEPVKKRRIEIRHLANKGLEKRFIDLFLKLIEYLQ